jgi:hypothetical protein
MKQDRWMEWSGWIDRWMVEPAQVEPADLRLMARRPHDTTSKGLVLLFHSLTHSPTRSRGKRGESSSDDGGGSSGDVYDRTLPRNVCLSVCLFVCIASSSSSDKNNDDIKKRWERSDPLFHPFSLFLSPFPSVFCLVFLRCPKLSAPWRWSVEEMKHVLRSVDIV